MHASSARCRASYVGATDAPEDRRSRRERSAPSVDDDDDDDALTAIPRGRTRARAVTRGGGADARLIESESVAARLPMPV